jgi:transposase
MIVIGLDVHKQSVTAVAVDEAGRPLSEKVIPVGSDELVGWAAALDRERLWAVEDCRPLTRWLERRLLGNGEEGRPGAAEADRSGATRREDARQVGPDRRAGDRPRSVIKLLVDQRDDLVEQRSRNQQRLRWHRQQLDPTYPVPLRMLSRSSHLERVGRWLARKEQGLQVRLARELLSTIRTLNRTIAERDRELEQRTLEVAPALLELPGCAAVTAAKPLAEIGPVERCKSDAQLARHSGVAPLEASSGRTQRHRFDRGGNRQLNAALYRIAITQARYYAPAREYLERKRSEGKSRREALRRLKRLLVRVVFNTPKASPALT